MSVDDGWSTALAARQRLQVPAPPLSEEQVVSWNLPDDQRVAVVALIRFTTSLNDRFLDTALAWETKLADVTRELSSLQYRTSAVQTERSEIQQLTAAFKDFTARAAPTLGVDVSGLSLKSQLESMLMAASNLWTEVVQLRTGALSPRCVNCGMPHFTQDCDTVKTAP